MHAYTNYYESNELTLLSNQQNDDKEMATVEGLQQDYIACKMIFNSCMSVKYYHELLNYIDLPVMSIHVSNRNRRKEFSTFHQVCNAFSEILLCTKYIHRIGRIAHGDDSSGHALLILRPEELGYLEIARVSINKYEFSCNKIADIQLQSTKEAFKNYVRTYYSHHLKQVFNIETLNLAKVAKSLGFHFKNINDPSSAKRLKRTKTFHQIGKHGQDNQ
ncbi:putative ATP-dependent RNA helicase pitchoune [Trachymyrmex septentrionalis]|uniref:Putative ATP-dependent RNA helicase pitchoune n=1 Tax=Trachymyrmex septentrionalis TaxID=34720 RepID=A0A195FFN4_9HYME|nr:putative ATP-dependent RNA helicase pitchoune [Trachymyrmex septentrionalis]